MNKSANYFSLNILISNIIVFSNLVIININNIKTIEILFAHSSLKRTTTFLSFK